MIDVKNKLEELGFIVKNIPANKFTACSTIYRPNKKKGWFKVFDNYVIYGSFNESIEKGHFWLDSEKFNSMSFEEKRKQKIEFEIQNKKVLEEDKIKRIEQLNTYQATLVPTTLRNAYLERKKCFSRDDFMKDHQNRLVIPMFNIKKQKIGYQYISDDGSKQFKTGSFLKGGFYVIKPYELLLSEIELCFACEGIATGLSIYDSLNVFLDAINYAVIVCFTANNVDNVVYDIQKEYKKKSVIAIKDCDKAGLEVKTQGFSVGFCEGEDANDIYCKFGSDKLAKIILNNMKEIV